MKIEAIVGKEIRNYPGLVDKMYEIYKSTVDKIFWGNLYFTKDFFQTLVNSEFVENLVFICARSYDFKSMGADPFQDPSTRIPFAAEEVFAGTINIVCNNTFFGRYWGCLPSHNVKNLHFEVSGSIVAVIFNQNNAVHRCTISFINF